MTPTRTATGMLTALTLGGTLAAAQDLPQSPPERTPPATQPASPAGMPTTGNQLARKISDAHGGAYWATRTAIAADVSLRISEQPPLDGRMTCEIHGGRCRIEVRNGPVLVFDGATAWVSPAEDGFEWARFHLRAWPYFLAAPFKLDDPGATLGRTERGMLNLRLYDSAKLTFAPGTGDSPDDWFQVFANLRTGRLDAMGYIVTYGRTVEEAEARPRVVQYEAVIAVGDARLPTMWTFSEWDPKSGNIGKSVGTCRLDNLEFVTPADDAFDKPADAREDPKP